MLENIVVDNCIYIKKLVLQFLFIWKSEDKMLHNSFNFGFSIIMIMHDYFIIIFFFIVSFFENAKLLFLKLLLKHCIPIMRTNKFILQHLTNSIVLNLKIQLGNKSLKKIYFGELIAYLIQNPFSKIEKVQKDL